MSGERIPSRARDRVLGAKLRAIRTARTELSLEHAADLAQWSASTMSRIETGKRRIEVEDVATLLTLYRVPVAQREELIANAKTASMAGWWDSGLPDVLQAIGTLAAYEAEATHLTMWSQSIVPGMLHIYEYAVAYMTLDGVPVRDIETRWIARQRRQQILATEVEYTAFIGEAALRTPLGGVDTLRKQLRHLLGAYDRGIVIRVVKEHVPHKAVLHSWLLMEFRDGHPVVYVELMRGNLYLHDRDAEAYRFDRDILDQLALSATESRDMIREILERT